MITDLSNGQTQSDQVAGHTPEPWLYELPDNENEGLIIGRHGGVVVDGDFSNDNARRIVAAVNACKNISTEDLEKFGRWISSGEFCDPAELTKMEKQRDDLLAALKGMARYFGKWPEFVPSDECISKAQEAVNAMNAAISKSEA